MNISALFEDLYPDKLYVIKSIDYTGSTSCDTKDCVNKPKFMFINRKPEFTSHLCKDHIDQLEQAVKEDPYLAGGPSENITCR